ncbi:hypothetical protein [Streptomyces sp. NPDC057403]|uniref:hypothetical protein n=1 Tax=Streptomyces sp. NPDC057403 TaxID=3346119 RepID=UPI0036CDD7BB
MPVLVAARVVQGVGAALLLPGTLATISRAFPDDAARARAIGVGSAGLYAAAAVLALAVLPGALLSVRRAGGER